MRIEIVYMLPVGALGSGTGKVAASLIGEVNKNMDGSLQAEIVSCKASFPSTYDFNTHAYAPDQILEALPALSSNELEFMRQELVIEYYRRHKRREVNNEESMVPTDRQA